MEFLKNSAVRTVAICIGLLFVVSLVYFSPLLRGKVLPQTDVLKARGMQKNIEDYRAQYGEEAYWSTSMFSGMPAQTIGIRYKGNIMDGVRHVFTLGLPYPIGYFFLGMALFFGLLYASGINPWLSVAGGLGYGFFTYTSMIVEAGHVNKFFALMVAPGVLMAIVLAFNKRAWLGAALYALWMGLEIYFNHIQMTYYMLFVAVAYVVYKLVAAIREKKLAGFAKATGLLAAGSLIAILMNAVPLYPLYTYTQYTIRGPTELDTQKENEKTGGLDRDYAYGWSYGRDEMLTLLVPNAMGGASTGEMEKNSEFYKELRKDERLFDAYTQQIGNRVNYYWGTQPFTGGPIYVGAVLIFLALAGLMLAESGLAYALLYATLLSLLLSLGKFSYGIPAAILILVLPAIYAFSHRYLKGIPKHAYGLALGVIGFIVATVIDGDPETQYRFADFFMEYLPLYNKFRVPSSMLIIAAITVPWLAMLGAQALLDETKETKERQLALYFAAGIAGGVCLLLAVGGGSFFSFSVATDKQIGLPQNLVDAMVEDRRAMLQADAWRSLGFILVAGAAFVLYLRKTITSALPVIAAVVLLTGADLWLVNRRVLNDDSYVRKTQSEDVFTLREADQLIKQDTGYFRVYPISRNPFNDGFTPYHFNSIGGYNAAKLRRYQQLRERHLSPEDGKVSPNVISMLNTRYVVTNQALNLPIFETLHKTRDGEYLMLNKANYGPAWIVQRVLTVPTATQALDTLGGLLSYETAVIEERQKTMLGSYSADAVDTKTESIMLTKHTNREMVYSYSSPKSRFVTFSEVYYADGWTATIDDKEAPILQTNFVLRGLAVPEGKHTVRFYYDPPSIHTAQTAAWAGSIALVLFMGLAVFMEWRSGRRAA